MIAVAAENGRTFPQAALDATNPDTAEHFPFTLSKQGLCAVVPQAASITVRHLSASSDRQLCWGAKSVETPSHRATCGDNPPLGLVIASFSITCSAPAMALCRQYDGIEEIWFKNGSVLLGRVMSQKGNTMTLVTTSGAMTVPVISIERTMGPLECP